MTTSEPFPTLPVSTYHGTMADAAAGLVTTEWYAPSSYAYVDPYTTHYVPSTVEQQQWTQYARASVADISVSNFAFQAPSHSHHQQMHHQFKDLSRPRSSPSTFGPGAENVSWPTTNGLGIYSTTVMGQPTPPITSTFPPSVFHNYPADEQFGGSPPEIRQPQPRRPFPNIAPNPAQVAAQKRKREEEEPSESTSSSGKKRKRTSSVASAELSEDDRFLVQLKEDEALPWKDIANRFQSDLGKNFQVAALQMRYKRLREKFRVWEEQDMHALKMAHEYWEKYKWEIIGAKMLDFGINERWPARHCARKWQDLEATAATMAATASMTPALSQFGSPVEAPTHFGFIPLPPQ